MCDHGECQAGLHPGRICAHRIVDELAQFGKLDDLIDYPVHVSARLPLDLAIDVYILPAAQVVAQADAERHDRGDRPRDANAAGCWLRNTSDHVEESGLAGTIASNYAETLALSYGKGEPVNSHLPAGVGSLATIAGHRGDQLACCRAAYRENLGYLMQLHVEAHATSGGIDREAKGRVTADGNALPSTRNVKPLP
ncbi:MAG: hypothetical protein AW07_00887 [Candidatus Accumulibacter sp. SK-11]|nr:MAG: hypothetical protein AW07_00887 [Candidatus Accumulibacter sp. SK-11]